MVRGFVKFRRRISDILEQTGNETRAEKARRRYVALDQFG
jgi:hypothetical protein